MSRRGMGTLYQRGPVWWIQYWDHGTRFRESSKSSVREDAVDLLKRRQGEAATGKAPTRRKVTVGQLLDLVIQDYIRNGQRSLYDLKLRIEKRIRPGLGSLRADKLGTRAIEQYMDERRAAGVQPATINRELAALKRAYNLAAKHDPPLVNRVPRFPMLKESAPRKGFVDDAAYGAVVRQLPKPLKLLAALAFFTGARKGELLRLRVDQIDLQHDQIRLNAGETKNDEGRVLPIYGALREMLRVTLNQRAAQAKRTGKFPAPWIFAARDGGAVENLDRSWRSACERAGVPGLLFHDLRRSAVRNMERNGVPRSVAMKISGHKTEAVYRRYAIVSDEDIAEAGRRMEARMTVRKRERKA